MNHHPNLKILAFVGLSGSGKTTAVEHFTEKGYPKVYFGGVVYQAMAEAGIAKGEDNEKIFRVQLRQDEGEDFIVQRIIQQIQHLAAAGQHRIIADGIYSWPEYVAMKHAFPGELTVVAITAPKADRYTWLAERPERPQTHEVTTARDRHEIEDIQKGGPIAAADYFVMNNGSFDHLYEQLEHVAKEVGFDS